MKRLLNAKFVCKLFRFNSTKTKPSVWNNSNKEKVDEEKATSFEVSTEITNVETLYQNIEKYYQNQQLKELFEFLKTLEFHKDHQIQIYVNMHLGWLNLFESKKNETTKHFQKALELLNLVELPYKDLYFFIISSRIESDPFKSFELSIKAILEYQKIKNQIIDKFTIECMNGTYFLLLDTLLRNLNESNLFDDSVKMQYMKMIELSELLNDPKYLYPDLYYTVGLHLVQKDRSKSVKLIQKCLEIIEQLLNQPNLQQKHNQIFLNKKCECLLLLSDYYLSQKNIDESLLYLQKLEKIYEGDNTKIMLNMTKIYSIKREYKKAREYFDKIQNKEFSDVSINKIKAKVYLFSDDLEEANKVIKSMISNNPNDDILDIFTMGLLMTVFQSHPKLDQIKEAFHVFFEEDLKKSVAAFDNILNDLPQSVLRLKYLCNILVLVKKYINYKETQKYSNEIFEYFNKNNNFTPEDLESVVEICFILKKLYMDENDYDRNQKIFKIILSLI